MASLLGGLGPAAPAAAADPQPGTTLTIQKAAGPIAVDGDLTDAGWTGIEGVTTWYETNPGDNIEPKVKNVGYLAYDDEAFYAAFDFADPQPGQIRAPYGDRDNVSSSTDYGGVILDSENDAKTAILFLANPRGIQYDAVTNDASGEDSSPDFYWEAAGKINETGWQLELRIPFSSLRYAENGAPQTWGILLYRNHPRDRRFQYFSARLPRDVNCFICNSNKLTGLENLPSGAHWVAAPYATAAQESAPRAGLGTSLEDGDAEADGGLDLKWTPNNDTTIDATINPDFSQIESDVAQISTNERFALFFPEKRPFFLEAVDLFQTPVQAVYTRSVTSPKAGLRATGRLAGTSYTLLATEDRGGGLAIIPGVESSDFALQDFESRVYLTRLKRDFGSSFLGFLGTARDIDGGGNNRVFGPDFQWRPKPADVLTGQFLWSTSDTPSRPELADEWDGRELSGHAYHLWYNHFTDLIDVYLEGRDVTDEFRADTGFVPQVGYREAYGEVGHTFRPKGFFNRFRVFTFHDYNEDQQGDTLSTIQAVGFGANFRWNSFLRLEIREDQARAGGRLFERFRPRIELDTSPGRILNRINLRMRAGEDIDFANAREGEGADFQLFTSILPVDRLALSLNLNYRWLDVPIAGRGHERLFTAEVARLRAQWTFNSRAFLRLIGQHVETANDPQLFTFPVDRKSQTVTGSVLFAYKINWQSVLFVGYGDDREYTADTAHLEPSGRQLFVKVSYAFQR